MTSVSRQLSANQFNRRPPVMRSAAPTAGSNPPTSSAAAALESRIQSLESRVQDSLQLNAQAPADTQQSTRQLGEALQELRRLTGSGTQSSSLAVLQNFQNQTLPQNLERLSQKLSDLQSQLDALPADGPERQALELQLQITQLSLNLYQEAEQLLAESPLLQAPPSAEVSPTDSSPEAGFEPLEIPDDETLNRVAPQLGMTGPELRNTIRALEDNIQGLNVMGNRIDPNAGTFKRDNAGNLASVNSVRTVTKALIGVIDPGKDGQGNPLQGSAAVIARTRNLLTFLMESRRLEQGNASLARDLGLAQLNRGVERAVGALPENLQNIVNRYIGNTTRIEGANARQRLADLRTVLDYFDGDRPLDLNTSRALFELTLDSGADAVKALGDLLPPAARERFEQTIDRFGERIEAVVQRLGGEAPSFLRGLLNSSPESGRQVLRFLTEDGVGRFSAAVELLENVAQSEAGLRLLGEGGQKNVTALARFLSLDIISQGSLRTLLSPNASVPARLNAFNTLTGDVLKRHVSHLDDVSLPSLEQVAGRALDRLGQSLGVGNVTEVLEAGAEPERAPEVEAGAEPERAPEVERAPAASVEPAASRLSPEDAEKVQEATERVLGRFDNLSPEAQGSLRRILEQNPDQAEEVARAIRGLGRNADAEAETILRVAAEMEPARALNMLVGDDMGAKFLRGVAELVPVFQRFGLTVAEIVPKLGRALGKAVPALGGVVSAYDAARMGQIAATGSYNGKSYSDPEVRALALLGASINTADTLLAVSEAFGIGNVAFPAQLGLAAGALAVDVLVEYFNDNPDAMPPGLRKAIRYTAAASAVAAPVALPGAGIAISATIANIYGADGTIDILNDLTRDLGTGALRGADKLSELHAAALDKGLGELAGGIHGIADVIRNPERYAALLGKEVSEVIAEAGNYLQEQLRAGVAGVTEVFDILKDVAQNPGQYAARARDFALELAGQIGEGISAAAGAARDFVIESVEAGWNSLKNGVDQLLEMGAQGVQAAVDLGRQLLQAGGEAAQQFYAFARDVMQDPGKYGEILMDSVSSALSAGWEATTEAADLLWSLAGQGIAGATDAIQNLVAAGGEIAMYVLNKIRNAPEAIKEAIGQGLNLALKASTATLEMVQFIINNPAEAATAAKDKAVELFTQSRDFLLARINDVGEGVQEAFQDLERLYTNTSAYLGDLGDRVGAALGRFEDTVVDLVGQGLDIGRQALQRYGDVLARRLPELMAAWQDLAQAPVDLILRIADNSAQAAQELAGFLAQKAGEWGSAALEGLSQLGSAGLEQLTNLAKSSGALARQALSQLGEMGAEGVRALQEIAESGVAMAGRALDAIAKAAGDGVVAAREALTELANKAGELGREAIQKLTQLGNWGVQQLTSLVRNGAANLSAALNALGEMGTRGLEALEGLAKSGARYARQAFNLLASKGADAIDNLRDLVTSGSEFAREAFNGLVDQGRAAIDALREVGLQVEDFAQDAIEALGGLGRNAEESIKQIGLKFREYGDEAIEALRGLGQRAIDSIESLANRYTELRTDAIRAFSEIGSSARAALNRSVDKLWDSGQAGLEQVFDLAGDIGAVSSRIARRIRSELADGVRRSNFSINPFNNDISPLTSAVRRLFNEAQGLGRQALQQFKRMAFQALRDLGVPDVALSVIESIV